MNIVLIIFTLQTVTAFANPISQTNDQVRPSIRETLSFNATGGEKEEPEGFTLSTTISGDNGFSSETTTSSKIVTTTTTSALNLQTTTPDLASHLVSATDNRIYAVTSTSTEKPKSKSSMDDNLFILIALILIALTLFSVALALLWLIRRYSTENRRSIGV